MLVVDDTRTNLLKMKEKLLKITKGDRQTLLDDYKELVLSIDKDEYEALIAKIKNSNYINLPLSEQVIFLNDILDNYNSLNELQCRYRNIYDEYSETPLELSDLSNILIDNVSERSSFIQGYLMNDKNLDSAKKELERLNLEFVNILKKENLIAEKIKEINESIKNNLLSSEGRILGRNNEMIYTSTIQEYKNLGFDLRQLLANPDILSKETARITKEKDENNETLLAAKICYDGNSKDEEIYNKIKDDLKLSEYALVLLEIVSEISTEVNDYNLMINKLNRLLNLIEERKIYLKDKYYIDPFDRIKIAEQLDVLSGMGDNALEISNIKKTINYFTDSIANMEEMNREYLKRIDQDEKILAEDVKDDLFDEYINPNEIVVNFNEASRVKKISNTKVDFKLDRVLEKTNNVILRVNELLRNNDKLNEKTPELIIENVGEDIAPEETIPSDVIFDTKDEESNIFENTPPLVSESPVNELFTEVKPFDEVPLFKERYDDVFDVTNKSTPPFGEEVMPPVNTMVEETMPDAFWTTKDENIENSQEEVALSFDEQIDKLINDNYGNKTKKKVA